MWLLCGCVGVGVRLRLLWMCRCDKSLKKNSRQVHAGRAEERSTRGRHEARLHPWPLAATCLQVPGWCAGHDRGAEQVRWEGWGAHPYLATHDRDTHSISIGYNTVVITACLCTSLPCPWPANP